MFLTNQLIYFTWAIGWRASEVMNLTWPPTMPAASTLPSGENRTCDVRLGIWASTSTLAEVIFQTRTFGPRTRAPPHVKNEATKS